MTTVYGPRRLTYAEVVKLSLCKTLEPSRRTLIQIADSSTQTEPKPVTKVIPLVSTAAHTTINRQIDNSNSKVRTINQRRRKRFN